jgi:molecular chaperone GrpE
MAAEEKEKEVEEEKSGKEKTPEERAQEYLSRLQYLQAEFENYRKREAKEREALARYAAERLIKDLLEVLDNLDRALESARKKGERGDLLRGIEMVRKQLWGILEREGVEPIPAVGKTFDPYLHEAVMVSSGTGAEDGKVVEELQKGYRLHSRVIRHARVRVAKEE